MTCTSPNASNATDPASSASERPTVEPARPSMSAAITETRQISGIAAIITRHASRLRFRSETNRQRYIDTQMTLARCSEGS